MAAEQVTLRLVPGGDQQMLRAAAEACELLSSLADTGDDVLTVAADRFDPAHMHAALARIDELHRAAQRGDAAGVRRRASRRVEPGKRWICRSAPASSARERRRRIGVSKAVAMLPVHIHSDREVRMAAVSGRMSPRVSLDRYPANPTLYGPARRGAALLCWGLSRRGAMMGCGERLGSVGVGVGGSVDRCGWDCCPARERGCATCSASVVLCATLL